jgi:hypothetical protein
VGGLHRGDDPGRREPCDVSRVGDLKMLDPPPPVTAVFLRQLLVGGDDLRIGRIADGMGRDLESVRCGRLFKRQ